MRSRGGLTDIQVRTLKPGSRRREVPDRAQANLYLVIQPSGRRGFAVRYRINGVSKKLTLRPGLSLADARRLAAEAIYAVDKGHDPSVAKKANAAKDTLRSVCERYLKREGPKLRTLAERESALRRLVFPILGERKIDTIRRGEISDLLDGITDATGARSADLVLAYLRKIFNWYATNYSDTFVSPIVPGIMARYDIDANRRQRFLDDDEIRELWRATDIDQPAAAVLRLLLLTAARKREISGLRWSEIDGNIWRLPAARHKNKRTDLVRPFSNMALKIIRSRSYIGDFVFTHSGEVPFDMDSRAARKFIKGIGIKDWIVHDIRRTSRTLLARCKVDAAIAERCLGHSVGGIIGRVYDRHHYQPEMLHAFNELAALVERIVNPSGGTDVTPLRRRR
jgi:integrase